MLDRKFTLPGEIQMDIVGLLITLLVTAVGFFILSKIPLIGVEIDSFQTAIIAALVFGVLNALLRPAVAFLSLPITFITFGLFTVIVNAIIFGLAAWLVQGFRLANGWISAILGAIALGFINSILFELIAKL